MNTYTDQQDKVTIMTARIDTLIHQLFKTSNLTFNEWVVITHAVNELVINPVLPQAYNEAQQQLLKET